MCPAPRAYSVVKDRPAANAATVISGRLVITERQACRFIPSCGFVVSQFAGATQGADRSLTC